MRTWTLNDSIEKSRIVNFQMNSVVREGFKNPSFIKNGVLGVISLKEFSLILWLGLLKPSLNELEFKGSVQSAEKVVARIFTEWFDNIYSPMLNEMTWSGS